MRSEFRRSKRVPSDPLERAEENALALRDLEQADARDLPDYDDHEESTARHGVPQLPPIHVHMHSEHDGEPALIDLPKKGIAKWVGLVVATVVAGFLTWLSERLGK